MNLYTLFAMAALGIGGGFLGLAWGWRVSTWRERWQDSHPNGAILPLGRKWLLLIPECRFSPAEYGLDPDGEARERFILYGSSAFTPACSERTPGSGDRG